VASTLSFRQEANASPISFAPCEKCELDLVKRCLNSIKQFLGVDWLTKEFPGTALNCLKTGGAVFVGTDKDNRNTTAGGRQFGLEFEAVLARKIGLRVQLRPILPPKRTAIVLFALVDCFSSNCRTPSLASPRIW
jgi:hypothetical protein